MVERLPRGSGLMHRRFLQESGLSWSKLGHMEVLFLVGLTVLSWFAKCARSQSHLIVRRTARYVAGACAIVAIVACGGRTSAPGVACHRRPDTWPAKRDGRGRALVHALGRSRCRSAPLCGQTRNVQPLSRFIWHLVGVRTTRQAACSDRHGVSRRSPGSTARTSLPSPNWPMRCAAPSSSVQGYLTDSMPRRVRSQMPR